jgi:NAD(P)-dependent dehydrogenase (short-subunit alcohol dehydrogenase family)
MVNSMRVVITGGSRGIGRELALLLAADGCSLLLVARQAPDLQSVAAESESLGAPSVISLEADVRSDSAARTVRAAIESAWDGHLDVLVNDAGVYSEGPIGGLTSEELDDAWATNARGPILMTQGLLDPLRSSRGHVVNVGSRSGVRGLANEIAYCASKHAATGFSAALREELHGSGVRISCVHPGPVNTWGASGADARGLLAPRSVAEFLRLVVNSDAEFYDARFALPE